MTETTPSAHQLEEAKSRAHARMLVWARRCKNKSPKIIAGRILRTARSMDLSDEATVHLEMPGAEIGAIGFLLALSTAAKASIEDVLEMLRMIRDGDAPPDMPKTFKMEDAPLYLLTFGALLNLRDGKGFDGKGFES